ncbi:MAG: proteasome accessory factor PafA2 family protein [Parcubacteria group bacterium]|nr:proteasome accessory factor PafA2 family protein [Parcubacteria group bacterium]
MTLRRLTFETARRIRGELFRDGDGEMADSPRIIIGAETEYGMCVCRDGRMGSPHETDMAAHQFLEIASVLFPHAVLGSWGGIRTHGEHRRADRLARPFIGDEEKRARSRHSLSFSARAQRMGLSGVRLSNGARFYVDLSHPEYSIPETTNPLDAVIAQKAGDAIVEAVRYEFERTLRIAEDDPALSVLVIKNNSDGKGNSYGAHEDYSLTPRVFRKLCEEPDEKYTGPVAAFFVARQVLTGAGKIGAERGRRCLKYQISQRADFITSLSCADTTHRRGIINTRDIPYADPDIVRRFHVIVGDGNMSEVSLYLKFGLTALLCTMLDGGWIEGGTGQFPSAPLIAPVNAYHAVSRDVSLQYRLAFKDGTQRTALEIMRAFTEEAERFIETHGLGPSWQNVARVSYEALRGLAENTRGNEYSRSLDWVAKKRVLDGFRKKTGADIFCEECRQIDLLYHAFDPTLSIFSRLVRRGDIKSLVPPESIRRAILSPPDGTRAWLRAEIARRYRSAIKTMSWNFVIFADQEETTQLLLDDPFLHDREKFRAALSDDPPLAIFLERVAADTPRGAAVR